MAIGNQASVAGINQTLGSLAISLRDRCDDINNFFEWVNSLGQAGLVALGFSSGDATSVINMASYLHTISGVYYGTVTQGTLFNFDNALCGLWGGF